MLAFAISNLAHLASFVPQSPHQSHEFTDLPLLAAHSSMSYTTVDLLGIFVRSLSLCLSLPLSVSIAVCKGGIA